jgi:hypothetical protein
MIDERWFDLLKKHQSDPEIAELITAISNSARLDQDFKNVTGKTISEALARDG